MKRKIVKKRTILSTFFVNRKFNVILLLFVLISSILFTTFAWYQSQVSVGGSIFKTGSIEYIINGYGEDGTLVTTIEKSLSGEQNDGNPLFTKVGWSAGSVDSAFLTVENTGSLDMEYKIGFNATGDVEYLGGFWYALTDITDKIGGTGTDSEKLAAYITAYPQPKDEADGYNMATVSRYSTFGAILKENADSQKRYYRLDYGMCASATPAEYTNKTIRVTPTIFVTQEGALDKSDGGHIYNCSTADDIKNVRDACLPGDSIRLMNNIVFSGDLVFNKATNIITNNYTLTVEGNLIYDFASPKDYLVDVTGNGVVQAVSPAEGVGGNIIINTPESNVTITGSGSGVVDIIAEGELSVNATRAYGEAGATFTGVKIVDGDNVPAVIYVADDTRITVSENTVIERIEAVERARFIEVQNAGTVETLVFSGMNRLANPTSPQIYVVNMGYIVNPIELPEWSERFEINTSTTPYTYSGNTRIVQTITGNNMTVVGSESFSGDDIERESTDITVVPVGNNDGELIVYYQDIEGQTDSSVQDLLEKYFTDKGDDPTSRIAQITRLDIISIGDKKVDNTDIAYLNSMQSLAYLDLGRASVYDSSTSTENKLCSSAFNQNKKLTTLILPQNLEEIGASALSYMNSNTIVTIPASVTTFGSSWYRGNLYVAFSAATPPTAASTASYGMANVKAIFVEEYYVDAYEAAFSDMSDIIFPMAQLDDNGVCFLRQITGGDWEIVYYIGNVSNDLKIGGTMHLDGNIVNAVGVGDRAFKTALEDSSVAISFDAGVKYIGSGAFEDTSITAVTSWGDSLTVIEASAFSGCGELTGDIYLPETMTTIEEMAFYECSKLAGINTGSTTEVMTSAFSKCTSLVWVDMPMVRTLEQIGSKNSTGMFYGDSMLVSVKLPSLEETTGLIFNSCKSLREIVFGSTMYENIAESGYTSFYSSGIGTPKVYFDTTDVSEITITNIKNEYIYPLGEKYGEALVNGYDIGQYIYSDAFRGDGISIITGNSSSSFTGNLVIPEEINGVTVVELRENAFRNETFSSVTVSFSDSLKTIGANAFRGKAVVAVDNWGESLETIGSYAFYGTSLSGELNLPSTSLTNIDTYAFASCKSITKVNTGSAVDIGIRVFDGCSELVSATLPYVENIGVGNTTSYCYLFNNCTKLIDARLPKVSYVSGTGLFNNCDSIYEVYLGNGTPAIGSRAFDAVATAQLERLRIYVPEEYLDVYRSSGAGGLKYCIFPDNGIKVGENYVGTDTYQINMGCYLLGDNGDGTYTLLSSNMTYTGSVDMDDIPELQGRVITKIGPYAFTNYRDRTSNSGAFTNQTFTNVDLIIGSDVREIGAHAFRYATGILSVNFRNTETIGTYAFDNDTGLRSAYFENLVSTGTYVFANCSSLTEFIINNDLASAADVPTSGSNVFRNSSNVNVYVPMIHIHLGYYGSTWGGCPIVSFDSTYTDSTGDIYVLELNGNECEIKHFLGASGITSITVPDTMSINGESYTVADIREGAFNSVASSVASVTLPAGLNKFSPRALSEITTLSWIEISADNRFYKSENGILFSKDGGMLVRYPRGAAATEYTVPATVFAIGEYAFSGCETITSIIFSESLMVIDSTAFVDCAPASVTFLGATPPILMGSEVFDASVEGFAITVPSGLEETYVRSMNFVRYASFINSGTEVPEEGNMNVLPWGTGTSSVEYMAMPPQMPEVRSSDDEEEPT